MSDIPKPIERIIETYRSAVHAKNVVTLMHIYDRNVRVFDAWGVWSYEAADAWQVAVEGWFASLGNGQVRVTFDDVDVVEGKDFAFVSAIVTYADVSAAAASRPMQNRLTWCLRTSGHVLRIVHEHTSAPIGFEDQKAILQR